MVRVIKITIKTGAAMVAIAYQLKYSNRIKSRKAFYEQLQEYISLYGHSCINDHEGECSGHMERAEYLMNKYFN